MDQRRLTILFLVALTAVALYFCYLIAEPFLRAIVYAVMMGVVWYPLHVRLLARLRRPSLTALVSTLLVVVILLVPLVAIARGVVYEVSLLRQILSERDFGPGGWTGYAGELAQKAEQWASRWVDLSDLNLRAQAVARLQQFSAFVVGRAGALLGNVTSFVVDMVIAFFTLYFLFREGTRIRDTVAEFMPLRREQFDHLFAGFSATLAATIYGGLAVAVVQGTLLGLSFWVLGITAPLFWGLAGMLLSLLPVVGTSLIWIPAVIYLWSTGHWVQAIVLALWCGLVVGSVDNVLRPFLIAGQVRLHTLPLFLSLLGGVQVFGLLGLFFGPVVLAVTITLLQMLREELGAMHPSGETTRAE